MCSSDLSYLVFRLVYHNGKGFRQSRIFLLLMKFMASPGMVVTIYLIIYITAFIVSDLFLNFLKILGVYLISEKKRYGRFVILRNRNVDTSFSFFRWIFMPSELSDSEETENIIIHESIHASQFHSADNFLIGLTAAAFWFTPLIWVMKRSFHVVHEYLADKGTIGLGVDRYRYKAFLNNNVAEERFVVFSLSFNQSLKTKKPQFSLRLLL